MFVFCITIVKTLIFICGFLAEKTKEKAFLLSYSKSIILQLEKNYKRKCARGKKEGIYVLREGGRKFLQDKNVPILIYSINVS